MTSKISLPPAEQKESVRRAIQRAHADIQRIRNPASIEWLVSHWWLQGVRDIRTINYTKGIVVVGFEGSSNKLRLKYEDVLTKCQVEVGRLGQLDLAPRLEPLPFGLQSHRDAAVAQVAFDHYLSEERVNQRKMEAIEAIIQQAPIALRAHVDEWPDGSPIFDIDIVKGWEYGTVPASPADPNSAPMVIRDRWVPLEYAEHEFEIPDSDEVRGKLRIREVLYGETTSSQANPTTQGEPGSSSAEMVFREGRDGGRDEATRPKNDDKSAFVHLIEAWERGPEDTLARYIAVVGDYVAEDKTYAEEGGTDYHARPFPIWIAGYHSAGGAYPRTFASPQITLNKEVEELLAAVFKNIRDFDAFGIVTLPSTMGISERQLKISGKPKILRWEVDPLAPNAEPGQLRPSNSGALPGQIANFALQLLDRGAGQGALFGGDAPGRVDSQAGLSFIYKTQSIPLDVPARSLGRAFVGVYRALLYEMRVRSATTDRIRLTTIDDAVAGISLDPSSNKVSLASSPIPWPEDVRVRVQDMEPESLDKRKQELATMLQMQLITPLEFWIFAVREGLFPRVRLLKSRIAAAMDKALLNNILLFNDGVTPGDPLAPDMDADEVNVFLHIIQAFMQRPIFSLASNEIKEEFYKYRDSLLDFQGFRNPPAALAPEQAAMLQQQMMMAQGQGGGSPAPGGGDGMGMMQ